MASGDLNASAAVICSTESAVTSTIDGMNLAAVTDNVFIVPISGKSGCYAVWKVERAA